MPTNRPIIENLDSLQKGAISVVDSVATGEITLVDIIQRTSEINFSEVMTTLGTEVMHIIFKILISIAIYYIGRWLIKRVVLVMEHAFEVREVEISLRSFLKSMVKILLYVILVLTIVQLLGINTTSLVAMLASAGLAIGMALSGTLQNFAGGVMVLFLKPYKVGDYINAQGQSGYVKEIMLFTTVLETYDGNMIFLPNGTISSSIIDNYTYAGERRIVWSVAVSYGDDFDMIKAAMMEMLLADKRIINDVDRPTIRPTVVLNSLDDSAVTIAARVWVKSDDYWSVYFKMNEKIYKELPKMGARFPFPQMDVHIKNN